MQYAAEDKPFGQVDIIHEGAGYGIYRLRIRPGGSISPHAHQMMEESELVLGAGLRLQGKPVVRGMAFRWPRGFVHGYDNPSPGVPTVLCVDRPRFIPSDEVETVVPTEALRPLEGRFPTTRRRKPAAHGGSGLVLTRVDAAAGARLSHHHAAQQRQSGAQPLPEPPRQVLACRVLQPLDLVQIVVVEPGVQGRRTPP